ncbi:transcription factor bHLH84 [Cajanus cajan]|uniref:transcription factor bHLH84 n=1 Tax=Cajanus cajan TaxID=3821 RepID=UPI00098DD233|nr:transcription factor bHLH84 [Cajanus cajan]
MEPVQLISEEWGSLCGLHTTEEADFMAQLFGGNYSVTEKHCGNTSFGFWPSHESTTVTMADTNSNSNFVSNVTDTNFLCFSQGSSSSTDSGGNNILSTTSSGSYSCDPASNFDSVSMLYSLGDAKFSPYSFQLNDNLSQRINENTDEELSLDPVALADNNLQAKREYEIMVSEPVQEDGSRNLETLTKRLRSSIEVSKTVRNAKSRKNPKSASMSNDEDDRSLSLPRHSCFSQGDSNASLEPNGGVSSKDLASPNSYRKSRATTRPATDSQSLYARKRRERINERLRILQNLVPNGTKVDISTMLEEAVQYVKFLQLQIKLLSSDDLWMYAPIAFNGINMGLDLSISPTKGR